MLILLMASLFAVGVLAIVLLWKVESWLLPLLGWLDGRLAAMGFGTWSAGLLTRMEEHFAKRGSGGSGGSGG